MEDAEHIGKWMLFAPHANGALNTLWLRCVAALDVGLLGSTIKVSTMCPRGRNWTPPREGVICVYTHDYRDTQDVRRVAEALERSCEVTRCIYYKPDAYTREWMYAGGGSPVHLYSYRRGEWSELPFRLREISISLDDAIAQGLTILSYDVDRHGNFTGTVKVRNPDLPPEE